MKTTSILVPLLSAALVSAHGMLTNVLINGQTVQGSSVNSGDSFIRHVSRQDPNYGASNPALNCGPDSRAAKLSASVNPGDTLSFDWREANNGLWPHNTGPMLTYMASCGATTCDKFNSANAKWFKIAEAGKDNSGNWAQGSLMSGAMATAKIPSNLAAGNYLIRHEIIALHLAPRAEFYPGCAQLKVGGSQTGAPKASDLVSFPGGYSDGEPGITGQGIYDGRAAYAMPGPKIATLSAGAASPNPPATPDAPDAPTGGKPSGGKPPASPASSTPAGTPAPASTPTKVPGKTCKKKRRSVEPEAVEYRPRHYSRIMRRAAFEQSFH